MAHQNFSEHSSYLAQDLNMFWGKDLVKGQAIFVLPVILPIAIGGSAICIFAHILGSCLISVFGYSAA